MLSLASDTRPPAAAPAVTNIPPCYSAATEKYLRWLTLRCRRGKTDERSYG